MRFAHDFILDTNSSAVSARVSDVWPTSGGPSLERYTLFNLSTVYVFFLFLLPWQCGAIYVIKLFTVRIDGVGSLDS